MNERHFCLDDSPWFKMLELDEVTSTNDFLRGYRPVGSEPRIVLVTAEFQTAGRGAGENRWESNRGENLMFSILVHPRHIPVGRVFVLSEIIALSVRQAVDDLLYTHLSPLTPHPQIKWPNDIYYGDRKVCGMLIENDFCGTKVENCVIGVGVNVNQKVFQFDRTKKDGLRRIAEPISIAEIAGHEVERRFVLENIMEHFTRYYEWTEQGRADELHQLYLDHLYRRGEMCGFRDADGFFEGVITDVEPTGHLIVSDVPGDKAVRRYAFKEVEYVIKF